MTLSGAGLLGPVVMCGPVHEIAFIPCNPKVCNDTTVMTECNFYVHKKPVPDACFMCGYFGLEVFGRVLCHAETNITLKLSVFSSFFKTSFYKTLHGLDHVVCTSETFNSVRHRRLAEVWKSLFGDASITEIIKLCLEKMGGGLHPLMNAVALLRCITSPCASLSIMQFGALKPKTLWGRVCTRCFKNQDRRMVIGDRDRSKITFDFLEDTILKIEAFYIDSKRDDGREEIAKLFYEKLLEAKDRIYCVRLKSCCHSICNENFEQILQKLKHKDGLWQMTLSYLLRRPDLLHQSSRSF